MAITNAVGINSGMVWKNTNESVASSSTVQDDDELFFTIPSGANGKYRVTGCLIVDSTSATPNFKFKFTVTGGAGGTGVYEIIAILNKELFTQTYRNLTTPFSSTEMSITVPANNNIVINFAFTIPLSNNVDVKLQWSQSVSDSTGVRLQQSSWLKWEKIK